MSEQQTALYVQYPDFRTLIFNVITAETPDGEMMRAVANTGKPYKIRDFGDENIGLYMVLPEDLAPAPIPEDEDGPFVMFVIPNKGTERPKRLDLTISRANTPHHIRAVLVADGKDTRFDGDLAVRVDDSGLDEPVILNHK
jgi:hypothetical protein